MGVGTMYKQQALGGYHNNDDDLCSYSFSFTDRQGTHVNMSFQAEPEYDLSVVFQQFRKFLIASGHDVENEIGEIYEDELEDAEDEWVGQPEAQVQQPRADKFTMDNLPNNGWPFGGLTTTSLAPISVTDLGTMTSHSYSDWAKVGQFPTMAPLTQEQIQSWSFSSADIKSLTVSDISNFKMPGTIGGASVKF
jgi:hypothetical protein